MNNGLFKITDRIYQVRGFDLASMMFVETDTGLILIDPMGSTAATSAASHINARFGPNVPKSVPV